MEKLAHQFELVDKVGGITWSRSQLSTRVQKWCQKWEKTNILGKAQKFRKEGKSEKEEREGNTKQSKARKVCPLMGDLLS